MIRKSAANLKCKEILHFCKVFDNHQLVLSFGKEEENN